MVRVLICSKFLKNEQDLYGKITSLMSESYVFHTPESLREGMRRGYLKTKHPNKAGPFYCLLPINTQPKIIKGLNLVTLPSSNKFTLTNELNEKNIKNFRTLILSTDKIVIKVGGGGRNFSKQISKLSEQLSAPVVLSPGSLGVLRDDHPNNMHVGGSKGSISGNFAMSHAELLISIGSRSVCQSDCSGIGYPNAKNVININADLADMLHYNNTLGLNGDIGVILINHSAETFEVCDGERIAQMVIAKYETVVWSEVKELSTTERGAGGFGSTGKK